jgi:hypothetical protein
MLTFLLLAYLGISAVVTLVVAAFLGRTRRRVAVSLPIASERELRLVQTEDTSLDRAA